jgi:LacI family transcriptional regulator
VPFILTDEIVAAPGAHSVTSDDCEGIRLSVGHILSLGHRQIAYFAGDCSHPQGQIRRQTFLDIMRENEIAVNEDWVREAKWDIRLAEKHTLDIFLSKNNIPTAVVCDGDTCAAGVLRVLWNIGQRVPDDVSVIGYADLSFTEMLYPPLTTIMQPFEDMGRVAVQLLLKTVSASKGNSDAEEPGVEVLPTKLIVRQSTAKPRANTFV